MLNILVRQGYQLHNDRTCALRLTRPDPNPANRFRTTGEPRRILMHPISREHYSAIMRMSKDPVEAAQQVIAISTGAQLAPQFQYQQSAAPIDPEVLERMVENRTANQVAAVTSQLNRIIQEQAQRLQDLEDRLNAKPAVAEKRKPGRPKGSKSKRVSAVEESAAILGDEPELTPEQEAQFQRVMGNLGPRE